jgi:low temperature requirement protein LtrA
MSLPLVRPPQLRLPTEARDRHATWLELFYDLVFAVAISALGSRLSSGDGWLHLLQFTFLFLPVWWAWCGHTVYDTRFDTDDLFQRLATFGMMLAAAAMAVFIPRAFEGQAAFFAASYVVARSCLLVMYLRARRHVPEVRVITDLYLRGFSIGVVLWAVSIVVPTPFCYVLWFVGLIIDFATPWLGLRALKPAPLDTSHLPERFASFTIIVLGEIVYVIIMGVAESKTLTLSFVAAALTFCATVCIWWVYFLFIDEAPYVRNLGTGQPYIYVHLPLLIGLTITGIGMGRAVEEVAQATLPPETRWLLVIGFTIWIFSALTLKLVSLRHMPSGRILVRFLVVAAIVATMTLGAGLPPLVLLSVLVAVLIAFVVFEMRYWRVWSRQTAQQEQQEPET